MLLMIWIGKMFQLLKKALQVTLQENNSIWKRETAQKGGTASTLHHLTHLVLKVHSGNSGMGLSFQKCLTLCAMHYLLNQEKFRGIALTFGPLCPAPPGCPAGPCVITEEKGH